MGIRGEGGKNGLFCMSEHDCPPSVGVLHVDVHVLPGLPDGGKWVGGVAHAAHLSASLTKHSQA